MAVPQAPRVLLFAPYTTEARVCATPYAHADAHDDTRYEITKLDGSVIAGPADVGSAVSSFTVTGLTLALGESYAVRVRFDTATENGKWSPKATAKIYDAGFNLPAQTYVTLPAPPSTIVSLIRAPDYALLINSRTELRSVETETGHVVRRLGADGERREARFVFRALTESKKQQLVQEIIAAADDLNAFEITDPEDPVVGQLSGKWIPRAGRVEARQVSAATYEVTVDAIEAVGNPVIT